MEGSQLFTEFASIDRYARLISILITFGANMRRRLGRSLFFVTIFCMNECELHVGEELVVIDVKSSSNSSESILL